MYTGYSLFIYFRLSIIIHSMNICIASCDLGNGLVLFPPSLSLHLPPFIFLPPSLPSSLSIYIYVCVYIEQRTHVHVYIEFHHTRQLWRHPSFTIVGKCTSLRTGVKCNYSAHWNIACICSFTKLMSIVNKVLTSVTISVLILPFQREVHSWVVVCYWVTSWC